MFAKKPHLGHQQDHKILKQFSWKEFHKLFDESSRECVVAKLNTRVQPPACCLKIAYGLELRFRLTALLYRLRATKTLIR
jgi:hypothetical protein